MQHVETRWGLIEWGFRGMNRTKGDFCTFSQRHYLSLIKSYTSGNDSQYCSKNDDAKNPNKIANKYNYFYISSRRFKMKVFEISPKLFAKRNMKIIVHSTINLPQSNVFYVPFFKKISNQELIKNMFFITFNNYVK